MRLCICNPHTVLGKTLFSLIFKHPHFAKYDMLLEFAKPPYQAAFVVDGTASSLTYGSQRIPFISDNYVIMRMISTIEIYLWCLFNKINPFTQTIIFRPQTLDTKKDVLYGFAFLTDTFINKTIYKKSAFASFAGKRILHASHYYSRTKKVSEVLKTMGITIMAAEADLKKSPFFKTYFPFIKRCLIVPSVLRARYKKTVSFEKRLNRCIVMGTLFTIDKKEKGHREYTDFFKSSALHPMRKELLLNKNKLTDIMEIRIFPLEQMNSRNFQNIRGLLKRIFWAQKNTYHSFDIVEEYNKYQMFIAPEESIGLPTVSFIEGMACGCAFIGLKSPIYADLGMIDTTHYIGYDGTLTDLRKKIEYYRKNPERLKNIAENGTQFVKKRFAQKTIMNNFWKEVSEL